MKTVKPLRTSTVRETIVLETKRATVTPIRRAKPLLTWLMDDICSTPYAEVRK
jgi:hypothetical protein